MRIGYRILWIEDAQEWLESKLEDIEDYLNNFGFELECDIIPQYEERDLSLYDIIVVDFNLANNEKGSSALNIIRNKKGIFTEILFYSYSGEPKLRKEIADNNIDGVYCADRDNCVEKLKEVIKTTIRKTQEINNLRGLVMAETSELDNTIRATLLRVNWTEKDAEAVHAALLKRNKDKKVSLGKSINLKKLSAFVHEHFHSSFCFESLKRFVTQTEWNSIKSYTNDIIRKRNFLAHGTESSSSAEEIIMVKMKPDGSRESMKFTPNDFISLRKTIKDFKDRFNNLKIKQGSK